MSDPYRQPLPAKVGHDDFGFVTVDCVSCRTAHQVLESYRCFDCGAWLCRNCVHGHFNNRHEPHPRHLAEWEQRVASLEAEVVRLQSALDYKPLIAEGANAQP